MPVSRLFMSQTTLDQWLTEGRVDVDGETLTSHPEERRFTLKTAVCFVEELTGAGDPHSLVGRVKDLEQIEALGGEYASGSVILGDNAYTVVEGFVGLALADPSENASSLSGDTLDAAMRRASGENAGPGELDLLSRFLLQSRS
jgi:hypothetical protein